MEDSGRVSRRRAPKQERAAERRDALLYAAATLFAEAGYGGATMTQVARRAGASIGTLYDYFPDKATLAEALAAKYTQDADVYWVELLSKGEYATSHDLAQLFVNGILKFVKDHSGYAALLSAPIKYARSDATRRPLRQLFSKALRKVQPGMSKEQGLLVARVVVELLKALLAVQSQVTPSEREIVIQRFRELLTFHIVNSGTKDR